MKIKSPPTFSGPDNKELKAFLKATNHQMKTDNISFRNSNCLPMPITMSAKDYVDDLFHHPGEEPKFMKGIVRGDAELTLSSSDEHDSIFDVLVAFPQLTSHIHQLPNAGES